MTKSLIAVLLLLLAAPVMADGTWGNWTSLSTTTSNSVENDIRSDTVTATEDACPDSFKIWGGNTADGVEWKASIHNYTDGALICTSNVLNVDNIGDDSIGPFIFDQRVTLTTDSIYLINVWAESNAGASVLYSAPNINFRSFNDVETYGAWPTTHAKTSVLYRRPYMELFWTSGACPSTAQGQVIIIGEVCLKIWQYLSC